MEQNNTQKDCKITNKKVISKQQDNLRNEDFPSDVLGSYTGVAEDGGRPIQDADDL